MNDNPELRQTGRLTRIIDQLIQDLFTKGGITVTDHYDSQSESYYNCVVIEQRLKNEHKKVKYLVNGLTIQLIKDEQ